MVHGMIYAAYGVGLLAHRQRLTAMAQGHSHVGGHGPGPFACRRVRAYDVGYWALAVLRNFYSRRSLPGRYRHIGNSNLSVLMSYCCYDYYAVIGVLRNICIRRSQTGQYRMVLHQSQPYSCAQCHCGLCSFSQARHQVNMFGHNDIC